MLLENAPCVECMDKGLCFFFLKHRNIITTAYWILLLKYSFVISQGQPCWHTFNALMSAKNKRPIKCVKPKLAPLFFHSLLAWYAWLLYYKIQQFFLECVIMHECNNNFAFPSHNSIYKAILNVHCFFFPLVYIGVKAVVTLTVRHIVVFSFRLGFFVTVPFCRFSVGIKFFIIRFSCFLIIHPWLCVLLNTWPFIELVPTPVEWPLHFG